MIDLESIKIAIIDSSKGKRDRKSVQRVLENIDDKALEIQKKLITETWRPVNHQTYTLQEGLHRKKREIVKPRWDDEQIVHHVIVGALMPIIVPRIYRHVYGGIPRVQFPKNGIPSVYGPPARGTHAMKDTIVKWVKGYKGKRFYVAQLDIKKFYASVDNEILKSLLSRYIRDKRFLRICYLIIDQYQGLPLGFYTSPWFANLYLMAMDEWIMQTLKPDHYCRYVDNLFVFYPNKRRLHHMVDSIREWLEHERHLTIKDNWQVYRFEDSRLVFSKGKLRRRGRSIDCLGFVIHRGYVGLRKGILKRLRRRAVKAKRTHRLTRHAASAYMSYMGFVWASNTYNYYKRHIYPLLTARACKRRISAAAKKNMHGGVSAA